MGVDPLGILILSQRIAPANREDAFPSLIHEGFQILFCARWVFFLSGNQPGTAAGTKLSLAGPHSEPRAPSQVNHIRYLKVVNRVFGLVQGNFLAFADEAPAFVLIRGCRPFLRCGTRKWTSGRDATAADVQLFADKVGCPLCHKSVSH